VTVDILTLFPYQTISWVCIAVIPFIQPIKKYIRISIMAAMSINTQRENHTQLELLLLLVDTIILSPITINSTIHAAITCSTTITGTEIVTTIITTGHKDWFNALLSLKAPIWHK
jgi:hypothetical protein